MPRIGILTTHPIQYQVPWFRRLAADPQIDLQVLYCLLPDAQQQGDGFGVPFAWDIPLLDGYPYQVLDNVAVTPSATEFAGCDTPSLFRIVRDQPWDAFIVNGWVAKSCLQLLAACRLNRVPCIVRGESNALRPRALWKQWIHRLLLSQYSAFLSIGTANTAFYTQNGIADHLIYHTPYCIENNRFVQAAQHLADQRSTLRQQFGLQQQTLTLLFCGKFIAKKRPLDLLKALAHLKQSGRNDLQALMVGDGELRPACEAYARDAQLPVYFSGFLNQQDIVQAYVAADCLVLPSDNGETWGLVVNEAMACGRPAIVSDQVGCHPDLIQPGKTGYVYPMGEIEKLATCLAQLADAGTSWTQQLGQFAQQQVLQQYNYQQVVQGIQASLAGLLDSKH